MGGASSTHPTPVDELDTTLQTMPGGTFSYHVNSDKNDFANWVRDVIGDVTLARNLRKAADRPSAAHAVGARLSQLRARLRARR